MGGLSPPFGLKLESSRTYVYVHGLRRRRKGVPGPTGWRPPKIFLRSKSEAGLDNQTSPWLNCPVGSPAPSESPDTVHTPKEHHIGYCKTEYRLFSVSGDCLRRTGCLGSGNVGETLCRQEVSRDLGSSPETETLRFGKDSLGLLCKAANQDHRRWSAGLLDRQRILLPQKVAPISLPLRGEGFFLPSRAHTHTHPCWSAKVWVPSRNAHKTP